MRPACGLTAVQKDHSVPLGMVRSSPRLGRRVLTGAGVPDDGHAVAAREQLPGHRRSQRFPGHWQAARVCVAGETEA